MSSGGSRKKIFRTSLPEQQPVCQVEGYEPQGVQQNLFLN